ncbi:MAG: hypothetical protein Fur009_7400 [Candidatus Microgenomates bacterium]
MNKIYHINQILNQIKSQLKNLQFDSFLLAIKDKNLSLDEKKQIKISLGQILEKDLQKKVDFKNPDILILMRKLTYIGNTSISKHISSYKAKKRLREIA